MNDLAPLIDDFTAGQLSFLLMISLLVCFLPYRLFHFWTVCCRLLYFMDCTSLLKTHPPKTLFVVHADAAVARNVR